MKEVERKFLIKFLPLEFKAQGDKLITQHYIINKNKFNLRLRLIKTEISENYTLTLKTGKGIVRREFEVSINKRIYNYLKRFAKETFILKERKSFHALGLFKNKKKEVYVLVLKVEIDKFLKPEELQLVEIEFPNRKSAEEFVLFDWLGKEVTNNLNFYNSNMVKNEK